MSDLSNTQFFQVEPGTQISAKDILEIVFKALKELCITQVTHVSSSISHFLYVSTLLPFCNRNSFTSSVRLFHTPPALPSDMREGMTFT